MKTHHMAATLVVFGLFALGTPAWAKDAMGSAKIPAPVMKTFRAAYPKAKIHKLDVETEGGVDVYDFEFRDGPVERETDIAGDGTMLETTLVIHAKAVPAAAMSSIKKAANGATLGRIERITIDYETKDAKPVKLAKSMTRYAAEMAKGGKKTEVIVDLDGTVVEPAKW